MQALREGTNIQEVREILEEFPRQIEDIYHATWRRICEQPPKLALLAQTALMWLFTAACSLEIEALRSAVATSLETFKLEPHRIVPEDVLTGVCLGLITVEKETRLVRPIRKLHHRSV